MKYDLSVAAIVLNDVADSNYEVLLCDTGQGWSLPTGEMLESTSPEFQNDGESEALFSCFTHLLEQTNIEPEMIDESEMTQSKLWFVTNEKLCLVYYAFTEPTKASEMYKAMDDKKGNARFFPYDHNSPDTFPELAQQWMAEALHMQMMYFNKRQN